MYQKSQANSTLTPVELGLRAHLEALSDKAAAIHGRADALREHCFGSFVEEDHTTAISGGKPSILDLCQAINNRLTGIDNAIEFLTARF